MTNVVLECNLQSWSLMNFVLLYLSHHLDLLKIDDDLYVSCTQTKTVDKMFFFYLRFLIVIFVVDVTICAHSSLYENLVCRIIPFVQRCVYIRGS